MGTGNPTVVFEADLDQLGSSSWDRIQSEVGKFTRACSYDRAGILWSEPGPRPRDGETIASELGAVLDAAGEDGQNWIDVGRVEGATCDVDIAPSVKAEQRFRFVRLTDAKAGKSNDSEWPGADINAVGAINTLPILPAETSK